MPSTFTFEEALEAPPTTFDFEEAKQPDPEQPAPVEVPQEPTRARSRLSRFGSGFKEELIARPTTTSVPFLGGAVDFVDALTVYNAAKRVSKADTDGSEPSDKDLMVLKQFSDEQNRRRNLEGAEKVGSMVGGILLQLPAFAGELAATGGLYTAGRKIGQRLALKAAEKFIDDASEKALVKYGARIAGGMAGTALQAPAAGAQRIAAETVQRMTPQIAAGEDEAGKLRAIIKDNGDDFAPAVAKALGSQYVEVLSEHSGGMAGEVLGKVPGVAALQRLKEKVIAKWFQTHPSATIDELLKQLKERGAWHGMVNEMIEERLGEIGRIPIEGEYRPPDKEQLAAEAIGFSIPGAAAYGLRKLTGRKEPPDAIPERTPTPLSVGETPEDRPPLVPQVRQQTEATPSAPTTINPGGPVADLPPDLKSIEAENAAKQRKIADDFKAEMERKKAAAVPPVEPAKKVKEPNFLTPEGIPVWEMDLDPTPIGVFPNFKKYSDPATGVVPGKELKGPYDRLGKPPIVVWEKADGTRVVVTGRHKLDLAKREKTAGRLQNIPVQLVREADGWTENMAKIKDVEQNIQDNQGTIYDYAKYFREIKALDYELAERRGLFRESKGRNAFRIARNASEQTFSQWYSSDGRDLSDDHALAIANAAPGNEAAQKLGRQRAAEGSTAESAGNQARRAAKEVPDMVAGELFGDTVFKNIEAEEDAASMLRKETRQRINSVRGAANNPEIARQEGVDVNNPASVQQRVAELSDKLKALEGDWWLNAPLKAEVVARANKVSGKPAAVEVPKAAAKTPTEIANAESERKIREAAQRIIDRRTKPGGPAFAGPGLDPQDLDDLGVIALESVKYGFRSFVAKAHQVFSAVPQVWNYVKQHLHGVWSITAEQNAAMEFEDVSRTDARKIIADIESGVPQSPQEQALSAEGVTKRFQGLKKLLDDYFTRKAKTIGSFKRANYQNPEYYIPSKLAYFMATSPQYQSARWQDVDEALLDDFKTWLFSMEGREQWAAFTGNQKGLKESFTETTAESYLGSLRRWIVELEARTPLGQKPGEKLSRNKELFKWRGEVSMDAGEKSPPITAPEIEKLLTEPPANADAKFVQAWAIAELLYSTGFRPSVLTSLKLDQIDWKRGWVTMPKLGKKKGIKGVNAQVLTDSAVYALRRYVKESRPKLENAKETDWLFPSTDKASGIPSTTITSHIKYLAQKNGGVVNVEGNSPAAYAFRGTLITHLSDELNLEQREINQIVPHEVGEGESRVTRKSYLARTEKWLETTGQKVKLLPHNQAFLARQKGVAEKPVALKPPPKATRPLTLSEQEEFRKLSVKARAAREVGGPALTGDELNRYQELEAQAGAQDLPIGEAKSFKPAEDLSLAGEKAVEDAPKPPEPPDLFGGPPREGSVANPTPEERARFRWSIYQDIRNAPDAISLERARSSVETAAIRGWITEAQADELRSIGQKRSNSTVGNKPGPAPQLSVDLETGNISFRMSRDGRVSRELRVDNPGDLATMLDAPGLRLEPRTKAALHGLLRSGLTRRLPSVAFAITDYIERGLHGEYLPGERVIRFVHFADAQTPIHEFFHHLWHYLTPADRDFIRAQRLRVIHDELGKARNYTELQPLEALLKGTVSSDQFLDAKHPTSLYHLANEREFFVWMMQDKAVEHFTRPEQANWIRQIREFFARMFHAIKKAFNLTTKEEDLWQQIISGKYDFRVEDGQAFDAEREGSLPAEEPTDVVQEQDIANAKIKYAAMEIPRLAKDVIQDRLGAVTRLEAIAFDTKQYRAAKAKIDELVTAAQRAARNSGDPYWSDEDNFPTANDPNLGASLRMLGIEFDENALAAMQKEITFENKARAQFRRRQRLTEVRGMIATLRAFNFQPGDYEELTLTEEKLIRAIVRAEADGDSDNALGITVDDRSRQIAAAENTRPDDKAKSDSLDLPWVRETFIDPMESGDQMFERFGRTMQAFKAAMENPALPNNYKAAIANELLKQVYQFEINKGNFEKFYDSRRKAVAQSVRGLSAKLSEAKTDYGMAEFLIQDALNTAKGDKGLTGTPSSREAVEFLLDSYGAVLAFANNLRAAYPNGGAEAVLTRLLGGLSSAQPGQLPAAQSGFITSVDRILTEIRSGNNPDLQRLRDANVTDDALARILFVLNQSDSFADAVGTLLRYGNEKISSEPSVKLAQIAQLLESGDEIKIAEANDRITMLVNEARNDKSAAEAAMKFVARDLERAQIALKALDYGRELFDKVTGAPNEPNPEYLDIRRRAEEYQSAEERMIVSTGHSPDRYGATSSTFRQFKVKFGDIAIDQPKLTISSGDAPYLNESNFNRIREWFDKAQQYVVAFEDAQQAWQEDGGKSPEELGFDRVVYNGLNRALEDYSTYQDPTIRFFGTKSDNSFAEQWLMQSRFFRQYLNSIKQVNGQTARQFQSVIVKYGSALLDTKSISHRHRLPILAARKNALESHPELHGDLEQYRLQVFNPMASEGRKFGSPLQPGLKLPSFGKIVTREDMALMESLRNYYDDLRRNVTEKFGRGIIQERRTETGDHRVIVRRAASVGDFGLPMHLGHFGNVHVRDIQSAYDRDKDNLPTAASDLSVKSTNAVVNFWNRNPTSLVRHILDAGREHRAMTQDRYMIEAERAAAAALTESNNALRVQSLEDAIELIAEHFPPNTGLDIRQHVANSLLEELSQYNRNARIVAGKMDEMQKTEGIGGMSLRSEFTEPAAQFMFPSDWYDFGAVTDSDILHLTARVMHEPIIEVAKAMERMSAALDSEITESVTTKRNQTNYTSLREADRIKRVIDSLLGDFRKSWNLSDTDVNRGTWEFPPDIVKASLLANVPVNMRNVILGGAMAFVRMASLNRYSGTLALLNNLRYVGGIVARLPIDVLFSPGWAVGRQMQSLLKGPLHKVLPSAVEWIADKIVDSHVRNVEEVQRLGFSLRDPFLKHVKQVWRDINTFQSTEDEQRAGFGTTLKRGFRNVGRTALAAYRVVGSEYGDKLINSQALSFAGDIESTLRGVAELYGRNREGLGTFDPSDERWVITPNEFSRRLTYPGREKNLAEFRRFLIGADISLEKTLWDYYQQLQREGDATMFTDEQLYSLRRAVLREFNAGDALNRPTGMSTSKLFRMLATFQGWTSDFLLKFVGQINGARSQSTAKQMAFAMPTLFGYAVAAAILGLFSQELTDWYKRRFQGATKRQVTVLSKEFWTDWDNAKEALITGVFSTIPLLGDLVLFSRGVVVNNRGYEPTGRILSFGLLNSAFGAVRGMWNLRNDPANVLNPLRDFILQYAAFGREVAVAAGKDYGSVKQMTGAVGAMKYRVQQLGLDTEREAANVKPGIHYTATSGIREDITAAMMKRDPEDLRSAFSKLVKFYTDKGVSDPETNAKRDVRMMNPVVRAFGGKKPTQDEYDQMHRGLTTDQKAAVSKATGAWDWAAGQIGVNFSPILSSGGGNALPAASSARGVASGRTMASFGGGFGGSRRRRTSLRSYRTRGRSRLRRTRISRLSRRTRLRRPRLTASRIRRPRLTLA